MDNPLQIVSRSIASSVTFVIAYIAGENHTGWGFVFISVMFYALMSWIMLIIYRRNQYKNENND